MDTKALLEQVKPIITLLGSEAWLQGIMVFLLGLFSASLISFLVLRILRLIARMTSADWDDRILFMTKRPLSVTVVLMSLVLGLEIGGMHEKVMPTLVSGLYTMIIGFWTRYALNVSDILIKFFCDRSKHDSIIRPQTLPLFSNVLAILIFMLSFYLVFLAWKVDMTAWLASAGVVGIAVGFAAKDTLANLFSGVFIMADSPYKLGDYVVLETGIRGKITHIGIRSTRLLTRDDVEVTVPNSIMGNTKIVNQSGGPNEKYRIRVKIGVAYGTDADELEALLLAIAEQEALVCITPMPRLRFRTFGASSLDFELLCWIDNPELSGRAMHNLNSKVYKALLANDIEIPYTKQDLYIKEFPSRKKKANTSPKVNVEVGT